MLERVALFCLVEDYEYAIATTITCQVVWIRRLLEDLKLKQNEASVIFCNTKSAIAFSKNLVPQGRTKHVETKYHFIREMVANNIVELQIINNEEQPTYILTKAVIEAKSIKFRSMMGVETLL